MKDVKEFGAKGDGITDDTAAIQEALNHGGDITFSYGQYLVTSTIFMEHGPARILSCFFVKAGD